MELRISETNAILCSVHAIYWKHATTACEKWQLDLLWGYPRKSTACNSRVNYAHLFLCSHWLNLGKNLFKSRLKTEHVSHTDCYCWQDPIQPTAKKFPIQTQNGKQMSWTMTITQDNFISRSGNIPSKWNLCTQQKVPQKQIPSLLLHLPATYHVLFVSSRDTACEYFFKPRNSPSYIVQNIMSSLHHPVKSKWSLPNIMDFNKPVNRNLERDKITAVQLWYRSGISPASRSLPFQQAFEGRVLEDMMKGS